jgi:hypothetical protein
MRRHIPALLILAAAIFLFAFHPERADNVQMLPPTASDSSDACMFGSNSVLFLGSAGTGGTSALNCNNNFKADAEDRIGTFGRHPSAGLPDEWGGGVHTLDVYAEATIGAGPPTARCRLI